MSADSIQIVGARQHNLKNIDVTIPRDQLVVITGLSGSGKSSLAFNTLYAEGQRRYVESLSAYARQFIDRLEKPEVDFIEGLSPAIAIQQRSANPNPRSTVATTTEIHDYLRVLYAALGQPHDPSTGAPLHKTTPQEIVDIILHNPESTRVVILAPNVRMEEEDPSKIFADLLKQGFVRARVDGEIIDLEQPPAWSGDSAPVIDLVIDRITVRDDVRSRLFDSIETALRWTPPHVHFLLQSPDEKEWRLEKFTTTYSNPHTGFTMPALTPKHFSFNSHLGACPRCHGLGSEMVCDPALLVPDDSKSLDEGAVKSWWAQNKKLKAGQDRQIHALVRHYGIDRTIPFAELPDEFRQALFHGTGTTPIKSGWKTSGTTRSLAKPFEGLAAQCERLFETSESEFTKRNVTRFMNPVPCTRCQGKRLREEILAVTLGDKDPINIQEFTARSIEEAHAWLSRLKLKKTRETIVRPLREELLKRLGFLIEVGLGYLTLDRRTGTLSGGEAQRIRLATQIGSALAGVLYVLDEPTIGLHPTDNAKLIVTLKQLRDLGNSVVVVEHDEETIRAADLILDLGPGAGPHGGEIVAQGTAAQLEKNSDSPTGAFLAGKRAIAPPPQRIVPPKRRAGGSRKPEADLLETGWLTVLGAEENNLRKIAVSFPLGCLVCVTGVSGSGKSTLVDLILRRALFRHLHGSKETPGAHESIEGLGQIDKAIVIDQSPLGRSPRSNPVSYVGAFAPIRDLFSQLPAARARGYKSGRFSFNVAGGRCDTCQGAGSIRIDMHFLTDVYVTCEACNGTRYQREILDILYKGLHIADVLNLTVSEAAEFFRRVPAIAAKLDLLEETGLGYLKLGQSATTLSGGEAQRVKLASELSKKATGRTLYILDEPTTGLHFADVDTLLKVFYRLRDAGNSLIVIEHSIDVVKCADWVIDLGPGGGPDGGKVVAEGPPAAIAAAEDSATGRYLRGALA